MLNNSFETLVDLNFGYNLLIVFLQKNINENSY